MGRKKKKILTGIIAFLFILVLIIPVFSIIHNNNSVEKNTVAEKNKLVSQVLMTGNDYQLNYDREKELKEEMDERVEEIKKEKEKAPPQQKPETSVEIIEEIGENQGTGGEGSSGNGEGKGDAEDHKKPHIDEEGKGQDDGWGFDKEESQAEEERVKIRFTMSDIENGAHYNGDFKTFYLQARDYNGNKIYQNGGSVSVYVNGTLIDGYDTGWRGKLDLHFTFDLQDGANNISIIMVDKEGHRRTHSLTVYGDTSKPSYDHCGAFTFIFDMSNLGIGTPEHPVIKKEVVVYKGETVGHFIKRALEEEGYYVEFTSGGNYIPRIYKNGMLNGWNIPPGKKAFLEEQQPFWGRPMIDEATGEYIYDKSLNSLGEKDFFFGSGWCITGRQELNEGTLNGNLPFGVQASLMERTGDLTLYWTNCLGYDYNGGWNTGGN